MGYTPPTLYVNKIAGGWSLTPPDVTTTDDLTIYPNTADTYSNIKLEGAGNLILSHTAGSLIYVAYGATTAGFIFGNANEIGISSNVNRNILLSPAGSGKVKFGTFTASGDVAVNGSVDILDSSGNARKLATIA